MFKRFFSSILSVILISPILPVTVFAAEGDLLPAIAITSFTASPSTGFDPSPDGQEEELTITYSLAEAPDLVNIEILDPAARGIESFSSTAQSGVFPWDGEYSEELVEPGTYNVLLVAKKAGYTDASQQINFVVDYDDNDKPEISDLDVSPSTFDPDEEETTIEFTVETDCEITVEIRELDGDTVRTFSEYDDDDFEEGDDVSFEWDGENDSGNIVNEGTYKVAAIGRNDYGVTVETDNVIISYDDTEYSSSNTHISGINFNPSSTFEPADDDELEIEFDILKELDDLEVYVVRGSDEIEIYSDSNPDKDNNVEITWDGTDDGDYVRSGSWEIEFHSELDGVDLVASESITVKYDDPKIDDVYVSKEKFDNDKGEFTYVMFKIDSDALVDVNIFEDNKEDDELEEDLEVEKDEWYAIKFDGDDYSYNDDLDIEIVAKDKFSEDESASKKITIDLASDSVSSSKPNITNDYIDPVLTDGNGSMVLRYKLSKKSDVNVTIYKGKGTSSNKEVIELLDVNNQAAGLHTVTWDGEDDDGDELSDGIYTYKIVADTSGTDTEIGYFIVGEVGDFDTVSTVNNSSSSKDYYGKIAPNVVVDGNVTNTNNSSYNGNGFDKCSFFNDVLASSPECEAITWAKNAGIFQGYTDGTFRPYQSIKRAEMLKVALKATGVYVNEFDFSTYGLEFTDIAQNAWYIPFLKGAKSFGIFSGDGGKTTARPMDYVNRAEVLKFVFESLRVSKSYQMNYCASSFSDVYSGNWYFQYACESKTYSLFTNGNMLYPELLATRGEVASALYKLHLAGRL